VPVAPYSTPSRALVALFAGVLLGSLAGPGCAARYELPSRPPTFSADPSAEAQTRLLNEARADHAQGRYAAAVRLLERFLSAYPESPHLAEARWWLARSYEQLGDLRAALVHYRTLAASATGVREDSYEVRAMRRLEELRRAGDRLGGAAAARTALMLSPARLPPLADLESWMQRLVRAGVTTVVLEAVTSDGTMPPGVYFDTGLAPVHRDVFGLVLPMAKRAGLAIFAAVSLQRLPWVDSSSDWLNAVYDPEERRMRPSATIDLLNPAVQEQLVGLAADLARTGIEGVLVRFGEEKDFFAECGEAARTRFAGAFGTTAEPAHLCSVAGRSLEAMPPEFWRWVGWKSQERLRLVERMREAMRRKRPHMVVALEVHPEAAVDPLRALVDYGEDLVSLTQRGFDLVLARPVASMGEASPSGSGEPATNGLNAFLQWLNERAFDPRRLWITNVVQVRDARALGEGVPSPPSRAWLPGEINLLYRVEPAAAVP
jgi:tetratricopeptide (TPR) repeat protein